jgi:hypothetical protein
LIFSASRFVVVDDKIEHLQAITQAFQALGTPCTGVKFDPADDLNPAHFSGVRCLFLDLHLTGGQIGTDHRGDFARIQTILEDNISPQGGPFVLVMWTQHPHLRDSLTEYLDANLDQDRPHARPLAVMVLAKEQFIRDDAVVAAPALKDAVQTAVSANPQLATLLSWETDVMSAAAQTLADLLKLIPSAQRTSAAFPDALDVILSRLARAAVGRPNVAGNQRTAITNALAPILIDRVLNQAVTEQMSGLWDQAITKFDEEKFPAASPQEAGEINRMLHVAKLGSEVIKPTDWGAVVDMPQQIFQSEELFRNKFEGSIGEILTEEFKVKPEDQQHCRLFLVRVGAACDYAQQNRGPRMYLLGVEIPNTMKRGTPPGSEWKSPIFMRDGIDAAFHLHINARFCLTASRAEAEAWNVKYRLREQLLMMLITFSSNYVARPGIVSLAIK